MKKFVSAIVLVAAVVWLLNTSLFASPPAGAAKLLAHRGVHQTYPKANVGNDTCTAAIINTPRHGYLENTIASMQAAFEAGADVVELDVHLTPDKQFAVFHDWTLDCRTEAKGVTEETPMAALKALDIGYGYTADGGRTFPFRGKGIGQMPTLDEVLAALPDRKFLVNFKSRRAEEGTALAARIEAESTWREAVFGVYGGEEPTRETLKTIEGMRGYDRTSTMACLGRYLGYGWTGLMPEACKNTLVIVPGNYAPFLWGWPDRFAQRMKAAGSEIILLGPYHGGDFTTGIDTTEDLELVPSGFSGYVWTNRIETIGPALAKRQAAEAGRG
ncbi:MULTISPECIES: glycerophosphodiester phosphodiesterase family protein [unclassified Ensifer]|uniref:glycerophosphodiester phosphodiesterase family protein n=1 Tax=unclassified Ensifer TaxID=2633371 RepID=UPI000813CD16|nr:MULTISPECIES: glycerophosphodiester phosphodiesterase family protein [unclassified Ensifer]OCO98189.1 glycerophosphodiester phosphodiesterase [Ensifer sp. LC14]OCP03831.1 glycerophosphodiester phosphodiesterase [Ensifer sp. LC11]OCP04195.1 glycerophosphodiester phosphodiesterase [Ensifer sp. LC13]OCP30361.1 glycerophosphodiester phosphodiesterase [Ensifer sp. LC499]